MSRRAICAISIVTTLAVASASVSHAQFALIFDWNNPSGGGYANTFNWSQIGFPLGIPDNGSEIARFQLIATPYSVAIDADYTVGSLAARQQGDVTLAFTPPGTFTPRKIYTTGALSVDPTDGGTVTLGLSSGDVRVSGDTYVARDTSNGQANLNLSGTLLTTASAEVGVSANSIGHVVVDPASNWTASGPLTLGAAGDAQLDVDAFWGTSCFIVCVSGPRQGRATHAGVVMAQSGGSIAAAEIYGLWNTGDLVVGDAGDASVGVLASQLSTVPGNPFSQNVSSAGLLTSTSASIGAQPGSSGVVEVIGSAIGPNSLLAGAWNISGALALGGTSNAAGGDGTLIVGPFNPVTVGADLKIWSGGAVIMSENGVLSVTGAANLDGTLSFIPIATPNPQLGNVFQILSATGGVTGTFVSTEFPMLDSGLAWAINYDATSVSIEVVEGLPGDYNQNGTVDAADYTVWRDNLGSLTSLPNDDTAGVDQDDYTRWKTHFGESSGMGGFAREATTVPEPASLICFAIAIGAIGYIRPLWAI